MTIDPVTIARAQFGFTIGFHILWPSLTIGLSTFVVLFEALWLTTGKPVYRQLMDFWMRLFALAFGVGVVTGVVLAYQIGTNWSNYADMVGGVLGPLLTAETLTAFFLEAGFIGVMLFGLERVGPRIHFFASSMVALGTIISTFWILVANSWMQTPAGTILDPSHHFVVVDWMKTIFNPSMPYRIAHMVCASFLTATFVVAGVSAWYLLRGRSLDFARAGFSTALWAALILAPVQIALGDMHGLNTREHQPAKLAAIEARWNTRSEVPLTLFAIPDQAAATNHFNIEVPYLGSIILTHSLHGTIEGLKDFPADQRPYVLPIFFAFRIMAGLGFAMVGVALSGLLLRRKGRLFTTRWFHKVAVAMTPAGFIAVLAGWTVTEEGRQPWTVYGLLRTAHSASPLTTPEVATSMAVFVVLYSLLLVAVCYYAARIIAKGPDAAPHHEITDETRPGWDASAQPAE